MGSGVNLIIGKLLLVSYAWEGDWNPWGAFAPLRTPWIKPWYLPYFQYTHLVLSGDMVTSTLATL